MDAILKGLNAAQRAAVTSPASVLQVLAPPGSGKTKTLTSRVAYLLAHHGYAPWNVICCTFTIKASREMRERLRGIVGEQEAKLQLGTFHSICRRYLVRYGHLIGLPKNFGIADSNDSLAIIKRAVRRLNLNIDPKVARSRISHRKARGFRLKDLPKTTQKTIEAQELLTIFTEYESALATSNLLDYDDLLIRCSDLLRKHPQCVSNVEALLIDEFQDTNVVQFELMKLLASARKRITVVGDPDQSIYGFRSAEIENLHRMRAYYPDTVVINLEENYRSSSAVLKLAQDVIEQDTERPDKKLKSTHCYGTLPVLRRLPNPHEEALWVVSEIRRMIAMTGGLLQYSDIAILLRSTFLSLLIEKNLAKKGIPYRMVGGHRFFERVEIRVLLDYLRTISQPDNNSALLSIINVPSRKAGETTLKELLRVGEEKKLSLWSTLQKALSGKILLEKKLAKPTEQNLRKLVGLIEDARKKVPTMVPNSTPKELLELVIAALNFKDEFLKIKYQEDFEDRWENVQELLTQAADMAAEAGNAAEEDELPNIEGLEQQEVVAGEEVLARFLANIALSTEVEATEEGETQHRVTISTIHSAKGLEWPVVFVPAAYEGSIPHSRAEDTAEERRLLYVAMTRAQALLTLTFPIMQSREQSESILSQFLPSQVHRRFSETGPDFSDKVVADIATILRRTLPTQEALLRSQETIIDAESSKDDVWPADGSHRPTRLWDQDAVSGFQFTSAMDIFQAEGSSSSTKFKHSDKGMPPGFGDFTTARRHMSTVRTTMTNHQAFSTSNASLTFASARVTLEANADLEPPSTRMPPASKISGKPPLQWQGSAPRSTAIKTDPKQGNLSIFFSQGTFRAACNSNDPPQSKAYSTSRFSRPEPQLPEMAALRAPRYIPEDLGSHKLPNKPVPTKRPRMALEETPSPNRKRYVFLSSSPSRDTEPAAKASASDVNDLLLGGLNVQPVEKPSQQALNCPVMSSLGTSSIYRPASTTHTTSMSMLQGSGIGRKTLGLRRNMNGWDNRRNK